jgi:putative tricarboxylic transport membrane protein
MTNASREWRPERPVEIVAGTPPGGGLDRTARALVEAIGAAGAVDVTVAVKNVPGDGARKAWAYMDLHRGDPHVLSVSHPNLTTDRLVGLATFDHRSYTPIAMLYTEYIAFVVRADSPVASAAALLSRMREDAASLSVALSTALGNPNHIALAKVVQHAGGDAKAPLIRIFDSALDAVADVLSGKSELAAVTIASTAEALAARRVRVLAVSAPERLAGAYGEVPTWIEHSIDCVIGAWRGIAGAEDIAASHVAYWERVLKSAAATDAWRAGLPRNGWSACYAEGESLHRLLEEERKEMSIMLSELGLKRADAPYSDRKTTERDA